MNLLVWVALVLVFAWLALRLALAITSGLLHLLWIGALVMLVMWAVGKVRKKS